MIKACKILTFTNIITKSSMKSQSPHLMRRTKSVEFPTSPQPEVGKEITHYAHSKHPLTEVTLQDLFTCSGCKEYGAGKRFACQQCEFQLHEFCAFSPPLLKNHPLHGQHQLVLHSKPKQAGITSPRCDICAKSTKGFTFRCRACSFQMHPCCAMLSMEITFPIHPHILKLMPALNMSSSNDNSLICGACKKKQSGRMYRCSVCDYYLHVTCAKSFINGLQANGITMPEKPSAVGTAARFASLVVIEFIGGLVEGLGEGMGEMLVQNITRGRSNNRRRGNG